MTKQLKYYRTIITVFYTLLTVVSCKKDPINEETTAESNTFVYDNANNGRYARKGNSNSELDAPVVVLRNHGAWELLSHENFVTGVTASRKSIGAWETLVFEKLSNGKYAIEARFAKDVFEPDFTDYNTGGYLYLYDQAGDFKPVYFDTTVKSSNPLAQFEMEIIGETDKTSDQLDVTFKCANGKYLTVRRDSNSPAHNLPKECSCSGQDNLSSIWFGDRKTIWRVQRVDRGVGFN